MNFAVIGYEDVRNIIPLTGEMKARNGAAPVS